MGEAINKHLHNFVAKGVVSEAGPQMWHCISTTQWHLAILPISPPVSPTLHLGIATSCGGSVGKGGKGGKGSPNALLQLPCGSCAPRRSDGRCLDRMADVRMQAVKMDRNNRRLKKLVSGGLDLLGLESATVAYGNEWLRRRNAKRWSSRSSRTGVCATHKYSDIQANSPFPSMAFHLLRLCNLTGDWIRAGPEPKRTSMHMLCHPCDQGMNLATSFETRGPIAFHVYPTGLDPPT